MTRAEFVELVEWIQDRWGSSDEVWANADRFVSDFESVPAEDVWAALYAQGNGQWAPRPMELRAGALERMRSRMRPERQTNALSAPKGASWSEWCVEQFGESRRFEDVIRERHAELDCRSPWCDIHREEVG
jgi:hypothetical protein